MAGSKDPRPDLEAAWWARLPAGGVRRVWVEKRGETNRCESKLNTAEQEAALQRLCGLEYVATADSSGAGALVADAQLLSGLEARSLETRDPNEAWTFLGADDAARNAMLDADPGLDPRRLQRAPR